MMNFVLRKIRDGRVKIFGCWFRPSSQWLKYDGQLEGMVYAFGLYWSGNQMIPFVCLWGSEMLCRNLGHGRESSPETVDGKLPWLFWHAEDAWQPVNRYSEDARWTDMLPGAQLTNPKFLEHHLKAEAGNG